MKYGFRTRMQGASANSDELVLLVQRAEELGYTSVAVADHIVVPRSISSRYPYSASGEFPGREDSSFPEQLTLTAFLAARTSTIRLVTSVMIVPLRPPLVAAKMLATVDQLSKGRLTVGCGVGWLEEEFSSLGAGPFKARGAITDEYIEVMKQAWTSEIVSYSGAWADFEGLTFLPKPVQKPHPPIWIGGESPPAIRRAVAIGDGWHPLANNPQFPLDTLERFRAGVMALQREAYAAGRDPSSLNLTYSAPWYGDPDQYAANEEPRLLAGPPEQTAQDLADLDALGVTEVFINLTPESLSRNLERLERWIQDVAPPGQ
jgi:probable F420-dependent oxidoreductase